MQIKRLQLNHIGRFEQVSISVAPVENGNGNVTVFVGNNGAGKTSLLKSIATSLSWLIARIRSETSNGTPIAELDIQNGKPSAAINIQLLENDDLFEWTLSKARKGYKNEHKSAFTEVTRLAEHYRQQLATDVNASFPLVAFYSVERVVSELPLKLKNKQSFLQLDGYEQSLNQGVDFRRFFEWFRQREDAENESSIAPDVLKQLQSVANGEQALLQKLADINTATKDIQLNAVRAAISQFMPEFSHLRVVRKPQVHMSVDKNGETLNVLQLSQGEKSLMALVGDIARRLAIMNPTLNNPLQGNGIVLIDEVDMHLHPTWQRALIKQLTTTFPNCQFILTTHSPLVISDSANVLTYMVDDEITPLNSLFGQDANTVLLEVMNTDIRNAQVNSQINDLLDAIQDKKLDDAANKIAQLEAVLPSDNIELIKAKLLLKKQVLRLAQN